MTSFLSWAAAGLFARVALAHISDEQKRAIVDQIRLPG